MRKLFGLLALFVVGLLTISMVSAATEESNLGGLLDPTSTVTVRVNDKIVTNELTVEEGETLEVEVELVNNGATDAKGIEVVARLSGYEHSDTTELEDSTDLFDVKTGTTKYQKLELVIPQDFDVDDAYALRVFVLDRNSGEIEAEYMLNVESPRHSLVIDDVAFSPGNSVKAGRSLLATVLLENYGARDEEDVKVTLTISELGVTATEFVDVAADESEDVPEMFLSIPASAKEGDYQVKVTADYDGDLAEEAYTIHVVANEMYQPQASLVLAVGPETQMITAGKTATYAIALTNAGAGSKAYTLEAVTGDWATATLSESLVVLEAGKNKVVYVNVAVAPTATAGEHLVSVAVKSGSEALETMTLRANVVGAVGGDNFSLRNGLEIALIVLVVLLVIIGLIVGFSRLKRDDEEEEESSAKKYY